MKGLAVAFGAQRQSTVESGLAAEQMWRGYQRTRSKATKVELIRYNADDLGDLTVVVESLRAFSAGKEIAFTNPVDSVGQRMALVRRAEEQVSTEGPRFDRLSQLP